jgi:peptidoglycan hydrolase CwlO-like protein
MEKVQETVAVHSAEIEHMKKDIDHIMSKVDKIDKDMDDIKSTLDEFKGGKKAMIWFVGIFVAILGFVTGHWMDK